MQHDADTHTNWHTSTNSNSYGHGYPNSDGYCNINTFSYSAPFTYTDSYSDTYPYTTCDANTDASDAGHQPLDADASSDR